MKSEKLMVLGALVAAAIILIIILWIIALIGALGSMTDGCLYRYNISDSGSLSTADKITNTITLKANANYTVLSSEEDNEDIYVDPTTYGKWLNTNLRVTGGQPVKFNIKGDVSLCKAYIPNNNLQVKNMNGKKIAIPRIDDKISPPVTLIFDAKTDEWRNLTELFPNDHVVVSLLPDKKSSSASSTVLNSIDGGTTSADCREGKRSYSPICGRYSIWGSSSTYVDHCRYEPKCHRHCHTECISIDPLCWYSAKEVCSWSSCHKNVYGTAPEPYLNNGKYTSPWSDNINSLFTNFVRNCETDHSRVDGEYQNKKYFWFSADDATGLLYRFDSNVNPTNAKRRGSGYSFVKIADDQSYNTKDKDDRDAIIKAGGTSTNFVDSNIILNTIYSKNEVKYLQYRFHDQDHSFADNTGGYVLNIKQTKCRRSNGNGMNDTIEGRGVVQYVISGYGQNPNNSMSGLTVQNVLADADGAGSINVPSDKDGYLWLKIKNDPNDYKDSFGQYRVQFFSEAATGDFYDNVLNPLFEGLKGAIKDASTTVFRNMTCYKGCDKLSR